MKEIPDLVLASYGSERCSSSLTKRRRKYLWLPTMYAGDTYVIASDTALSAMAWYRHK